MKENGWKVTRKERMKHYKKEWMNKKEEFISGTKGKGKW